MSGATGNPRTAIITGGAAGIGQATAEVLARRGYRLCIADLDAEAAGRAARALGADHVGLGCDVSREDAVDRAVRDAIAALGRIDVLVNNAGIGDQSAVTLDQDAAHFDKVLATHLRGAFLMSRAVARHMLAHGAGAIVNLSSIAAFGGIPGRNAYAAAKAGISAMTRSMACEWASRGVRVNAVAPGYTRTELVAELERKGALDTRGIRARTPMGRLAEPAEIARAIAFLASDDASYITGATLLADGGWTALGAPEGSLAAGAD
ncbi:MAG TPA: glucose 1-dehydrogenase [Castellaniella sp.]|jgi:NAD(P)-dependent dehydrogenase (short-subunit alcohol dehydrogenase family)|nr:glucose 1-dehydrogenase [Castellaniella sp.]